MLIAFVYGVVCSLLRLLPTRGRPVSAAEIELLALCHERRVLRRRAGGAAWRPSDRLWLAALSRCLPRSAWRVFPVHPSTLRRWHRDVVRRQWAVAGQVRRTGRPPLPAAVRELIVRLARENPRWGYLRIKGELLKLGHDVSATGIRMTLRRRGVPPAPQRARLTWPAFLRAHADGLLACDFFAVETVRLQVVYALFFIHILTRRVFLAGCTARPTAAWVTQQARNVTGDLDEAGIRPTALLRDRDAKFPPAFDGVFAAQGARVVQTPLRAPRANAFAERWVGTARRDCPDWLLILGSRHLERVLDKYVRHYNRARPHRVLRLRPPVPGGLRVAPDGPVVRLDRLGGVLHEYTRRAA